MSLPFDFYVGTTNLKNEPKLGFSFTKDVHGDAQVSYRVPGVVPPPRTPVKLYSRTYGYFWSGYTWQPTLDLWDCPVQLCRGMQYTTEDNGWNEQKVFAKGTPMKRMVDEAISKCQHVFDPGNLPAGLNEQLADDSENFGLQCPKDLLEAVSRVSAYLTTPIQWRVAVRGHAGTSYLEMAYTDLSPRYRVRLTKKDDFKPIYDSDVIAQVAMITWGNDQYLTASTAGVRPNTPVPPSLDLPNAIIPQPLDYSVIPDMRVRRVRGDNNIKTYGEATAMASYIVERNRILRPIGFTATIDCDTLIAAVPPVVSAITDNLPHYLVEPWHGIRILNDLRKWGPYGNVDTFYIMGVGWNEDGKLQLTLGDPVQLDTFRLLSRYDGNKLGTTIGSGVVNQPEKDVNGYKTYGPQFDAQGEYLNNGIDAGLPMFASDTNPATRLPNHNDPNEQFKLPFGAGIHPDEIADYGVQANFGREADSIGIKGFVGLIPMKALKWRISFLPPPGSDVIPTDTITLQFFDKYPFVPITVPGGTDVPFATKSISPAAKVANGSFTGGEQKVFAQGGAIGIRVSVAATTAGCGFIVYVGGRKLYPDLGVVT